MTLQKANSIDSGYLENAIFFELFLVIDVRKYVLVHRSHVSIISFGQRIYITKTTIWSDILMFLLDRSKIRENLQAEAEMPTKSNISSLVII